MDKKEKVYISNILKLIFDKSQESTGKKKLGNHIIEYLESLKVNGKEKEEALEKYYHMIKSELFDTKNPYKQQISHGDMKIFYSLFNIFKSTGISIENNLFLNIVESLFDFFQKKDVKIVRYSVNTVIKIIRENKYFILKYFNNIFDKLIILVLRKEIEVRNCGYFLDEIMKNNIGSIFQENYKDNEDKIKSSFKLIIDYLLKRLEENNNYPAINILVISWFNFFENIPKINLTNNYVQIIPKLLKMLSNKTKEETQSSELCLKKIINNIDSLYEDLCNEDSNQINKIIEIIIKSCNENEANEQIKKCSFELMEVFLEKFKKIIVDYYELGEELDKIDENSIPPMNNNDSSFYNESSEEEKETKNNEKNEDQNKKDINNLSDYGEKLKDIKKDEFDNNIKIVRKETFSKFRYNKNLMDDSNNYKVKLLMNNLPFQLFPNILEVILHNLTNNSNKLPIYKPISKCNQTFKELMNIIKPEFFQQKAKQKSEQKSPVSFDIIKTYLKSPSMEENNINLIFDWASQLYKSKLFNDEKCFKNLIFDIPKINEIIIRRILDLLNGICSNKDNEKINYDIITMIIRKFYENPEMISTYGILIIKELIKSINIEVLFEEIANDLLKYDDIYFVMRMLNMLNKFLITEEEANSIRIKLSKFGNEEKEEKEDAYFTKIFKLWSYNPFCTLILVLISNSFELGYFLINYLSQMKLRAEDYIELSQVVQVFESSIFNHVRIKLLKPKKYSYLIKTLYAILLLLPQGQAFNSLSSRLKCLQIIYNLGEDDDDETKLNFSEDSSNSICSNFEYSNASYNEENNLYEAKEGEISKKNNYLDKVDYEIKIIKKRYELYINIFEEIQEKREEYESNVYSQKKSSCCSPPYKNK